MKKKTGKLTAQGISPDFDVNGKLIGHSMKFKWVGPAAPMQMGTIIQNPWILPYQMGPKTWAKYVKKTK